MMNRQEIFNTVATHLLTQNDRAISFNEMCSYRAPDGKKCAFGILIPDHLYKPKMEGSTCDVEIMRPVLDHLGATDYTGEYILRGPDITFLMDLQRIHDQHNPVDWKKYLTDFAKLQNLDPSVVVNFGVVS